ncbi:hypothetical protein Tco_1021215 [Tanacetum coccineum]
MRTRSSSNFVGEPSTNPPSTSTNTKRRNRRRSKQPFSLEESPIDTMADQRTMAELLRAPTEGYAEAIVVPPILAEHFKLKSPSASRPQSWFYRISPTLIPLNAINPTELQILLNSAGWMSQFVTSHSSPLQVKSSDVNSSSPSEIAKLTHAVNQQTSAVTTVMAAILKQFQATPPPASVKAVEEICLTCGGAHPYYQCVTTDGNTFSEFQDNIQGYVSAAASNYNQGNSGYRPPDVANQNRPPGFAQPNVQNNQNRFGQPQGYDRGNNFNQNTTYQAPTQQNQVVPLTSMSNQTNELKNLMASFFQMNTASTSGTGSLPSNTIANPKGKLKAITTRSGLVLDGPSVPMPSPFINSEEDERVEETLTDPEHEESDLIWEEFEAYLASDSFPLGNNNPSSPLPPFHNSLSGSTTSSSPSLPISETSDYSLEEFADELAHFTFPQGIDYLPFDAESDLGEIEYLLNHDPIEEMDSILEDSVDKNSPDDDLVDNIFEMFTDEHALDYSSPPLWDDYDDELFDLETVNDNTYDDPFDSKEEKIKESKLLIDELDPPGSSNFLPFLEYDLVFYEYFCEVDALPSTNNEDKDFNPPLYELPFHKEVLGSETLILFSSENEEKVFNPGILTSKGLHTSLLLELSHRDTKAFKVIKIFESPMEIFPCSYGEDIHDCLDFEASRALGFCPSFTRASNPQLHFGNPISKSYRLTFIFKHT